MTSATIRFTRSEVATLLGETHPFSLLEWSVRLTLAEAMDERLIASGQAIQTEGRPTGELYVVARGRAAVISAAGETMELGRGQVFGEEGTLIDGSSSSRVVTALEPTALLAIGGAVLAPVARRDRNFGARLRERAYLRAVPRPAAGVVAHARAGNGGESLLLESADRSYFLIEHQDATLWRLIDGRHTVPDLMRAALHDEADRLKTGTHSGESGATDAATERSVLGDPTRILKLCLRLQDAGFVEGLSLHPDFGSAARDAAWRRFAGWGHAFWPLYGVNPFFDRIYRMFGYLLFKRLAQILMAGFVVAGMIAFTGNVSSWTLAGHAPASAVACLYVVGIVSMCLHELGHALATIWSGCCVKSIGLGWFWFGPAAFVDTSDTWRASRRARIVVSLAGPYVTLLVASAAALVAAFSLGWTARVAWIIAYANYVGAVLNLNPLIKLDGYYVLADALDRPNLRRETLRWMKRWFCDAKNLSGQWRGHLVELAYGLSVLLFFAGFAYLILGVYRQRLASVLATLVDPAAGEVLSIAVAVLPVLLGAAEIAADLAPGRRDDDLEITG